MADRVKHPPIPDGDRAVDFRLVGTLDDAEEWLKLFRYVVDIELDNDPKEARKDGRVRRYVRARLKEQS